MGLHRNPDTQGESRDGTDRILFQAPVGVLFEVDADQKLVRIIRSWVYRQEPTDLDEL